MKLTNLKTKILGQNFKFYNKIDSTQKEILRLIEKSLIENGSLIMADIQTAGIGTHGKKWYTDKKENIAFSFYLKIDCNIKALEGLTIEIAEIIVNIFKENYNIELNVKEPNDIIYNGKKIGGILTQSKIISKKVKYIVVGIGINITNQKFAEDIENIATSIQKEFEIKVDRLDFIAQFCNKFEETINRRVNT